MDCHFVRNRLLSGDLTTGYISSNNQPVDIFTKALATPQFQFLLGRLGIINPHAPS